MFQTSGVSGKRYELLFFVRVIYPGKPDVYNIEGKKWRVGETKRADFLFLEETHQTKSFLKAKIT